MGLGHKNETEYRESTPSIAKISLTSNSKADFKSLVKSSS